jgi:diaminopimelate epimerase
MSDKVPKSFAGRPVTKMNGLGNEILILDLRGSGLKLSGAEARAIARGKGLAFDQLMVLGGPRSEDADSFMTIFNPDGSEAGACGNGTRCVAWFLCQGKTRKELVLETTAGKLKCRRLGDWFFSVEMGRPRLDWHEIPLSSPADTRAVRLNTGISGPVTATAVNMGYPHAILFVADLAELDLTRIGPILEHHPLFPERANISLAKILSREEIELKVWERGTGLTRACGSAACAALVAAVRNGLTGRRAKVSLPGGHLDIEWREADDIVVMTGPVEFEFETRLDPSLFEDSFA